MQHVNTTPEPHAPAKPYVFSYQAGRAPGHVDRQHTEVSDGSGVIRGAFSYVDPKNQVRTVQYVADEHGFHPQLSHQLEDSAAVKAAKRQHLAAYNRIAQEHANHQPGQVVSIAGCLVTTAITKKRLKENPFCYSIRNSFVMLASFCIPLSIFLCRHLQTLHMPALLLHMQRKNI